MVIVSNAYIHCVLRLLLYILAYMLDLPNLSDHIKKINCYINSL